MEEEFKKINNLKWLPFIGEKYEITIENRMLIVGESHYYDDKEGSKSKVEDTNWTRTMIEENAIDEVDWKTKIIPNFHKAMFKEDSFSKECFWNLAAYYNFIQRPMHTIKDRPSSEDFIKGWNTFFDLIKLAKPKICVFIGVSASDYLESAIQSTEWISDKLKNGKPINGTYGRSVVLKDTDNNEIKLIFIKHTSMFFSWISWNNYLKNEIGDQLTWFENGIEIERKPKEYYEQFNFELKEKLKDIHSIIDENKINLELNKKIQLQGLRGSGRDSEYFKYNIEVNNYSFTYEVAIGEDWLGSYYYCDNKNKIDKLEEKGIQKINYDIEKSEEEIALIITDEILKIISILKE